VSNNKFFASKVNFLKLSFFPDPLPPHDFIDRTVSDENGKFVIHGSANDHLFEIDPFLHVTNITARDIRFPKA